MEVVFDSQELDDLEVNPQASSGFPQGVVKGYRKAMQAIRSAVDERDLYALKGLRFEKLSGDREGQRSLRCNKQYRLIVELLDDRSPKQMRIIEIVNYH